MFEEIDNEEIAGIAKEASYMDRLPRGYLSVSQVTQFMKCGKAYYFRYVEEVAIRSNSFIAQGQALHKAAELTHIAMMEQGQAPVLDYVESVYDSALEEIFEKNPELQVMEEDVSKDKIKDVGVKMIGVYFQGVTGQLVDPDTKERMRPLYPVAAERVFRVMLTPENGEPVPFLGVIDIEEPGTVRDLKTKRKKGTQGEADNSIQLSLYAHITGKPDVSIDQLVKPTKTMGPRYIRMPATRTVEEMEHALDIVAHVANDIAKGRFPLTMPDNWWCSVGWCPYWDRCRGRKR